MLEFCCFLLIINTESALVSWNTSSTSIPTKLHNHGCGYDSTTQNIFLYSGYIGNTAIESKNAYTYNVQTHATASHLSITTKTIDFMAPAYIGSPYWYFFRGDKFGQFVPNDPSITHPISSWINNQSPIPTTTYAPTVYACIAISLDGNYIFVTGGYAGMNLVSIANMQIYDIAGDSWTDPGNGPDMNTPRDSHACIVTNSNVLYVIGGYYTSAAISTIERIDINNIDNLPISWSINDSGPEYKLKSTKHKMNGVLYGNNIYVIGGEKNNGNAAAAVDIIDTTTNLVTSGTALPIAVYGSCSVVVNDKIYVLGGANGAAVRDTIIISNILNPNSETSTPTSTPTTITPSTINPTTKVPTTNIPTSLFPTTITPTTITPSTINPTTIIPTTNIPTSLFPTTTLPTTSVPTSNILTTNIPTTFVPTTNIPTTVIATTNSPTISTTSSTSVPTTKPSEGGESPIQETQPITTALVDETYKTNKKNGNTYYILYLAVLLLGIVIIMIIAIAICCICKNKKNKTKAEAHMITEMNSAQVVEMHELSNSDKVNSNEITPIETWNVLDAITPNGITPYGITSEHISDKNTESEGSVEGLYSDADVHNVCTSRYDQTPGDNVLIADQPDEDDAMYKKPGSVTKGVESQK